MPTYSIGDVQGCYTELTELLHKINFDRHRDTLWFCGDLVNRGPQSLEVLRFIKSLGKHAITVLGNHDLHLLAAVYQNKRRKKTDTLDEILHAKDCLELCEWLRQQPLLHHDAKLNYAMVHAGIPPQWDLTHAQKYAAEVSNVLRGTDYQNFLANMYGSEPDCWDDKLTGWPRLRLITNYFTRMRVCDVTGRIDLSKKGKFIDEEDGLMPWFKVPHRKTKNLNIIFGHWAALEGKADEPNVFALDTGCSWGNCLTAMRLEDQQLFSVKCRGSAQVDGDY